MEPSKRKGGRKSKRGRKLQPAAAGTMDFASPSPSASSPSPVPLPLSTRGRRKNPVHLQDPSGAEASPPSASPKVDGESGLDLVVEVDPQLPPPRWGQVVRVVPSMDAVVKVFCVHTEPNFSLPWQRKRQYSSSSSGFVISGRRVLTNAHSVEHYTQVKLKKRGSDTKYVATVLAIGTECDIAMLTVENDEFWEGVSPVEFGSLPALQDAVTVVGYPIGGDTISVTSGVVSRIEILPYVHGSTELLGLQIDAAINSGNSGGPAFSDKGKCVGIAFQSLKHEDAENIGYVIPTPVIMHFIQDFEKSGEYTGFPIFGVEWQKMENPDLRKAMGMTSDQKGVRVRRIEPTAPEVQFLKPSDIILSFDGVNIANDGTIPFRHGERIGFSYLVSQKFTGENAVIKVLRESKVYEFNIKLAAHKRLVPAHINGKPPSYYIIAGFVFAAISVPYLCSEIAVLMLLYASSLYGNRLTDGNQLLTSLEQYLLVDCNNLLSEAAHPMTGSQLLHLYALVRSDTLNYRMPYSTEAEKYIFNLIAQMDWDLLAIALYPRALKWIFQQEEISTPLSFLILNVCRSHSTNKDQIFLQANSIKLLDIQMIAELVVSRDNFVIQLTLSLLVEGLEEDKKNDIVHCHDRHRKYIT